MNQGARRQLVIVGCSARKAAVTAPVPALDLYQGWCVPQLRASIEGRAELRRSVLVLSAKHGLIEADTPLVPYDQPLARRRAARLRHEVSGELVGRLERAGPYEVLLLLEPAYLRLVTAALYTQPPAVAHWVADPVAHWEDVVAVLSGWGWCPPTPQGTVAIGDARSGP